jgi:hypothetical protein
MILDLPSHEAIGDYHRACATHQHGFLVTAPGRQAAVEPGGSGNIGWRFGKDTILTIVHRKCHNTQPCQVRKKGDKSGFVNFRAENVAE